MNKTHKRELKKIPKRIKLKKEPTIIHPTDTYTITPVKYEKKKKCQKFPTPRGQHLVHRYRIKKKRVEKEKKIFTSASNTGGKRSTPSRSFLLSERAYESMGQSSDDRAGCNIIRNVARVRNAWRLRDALLHPAADVHSSRALLPRGWGHGLWIEGKFKATMERVLTRYAASTDLRANAPFVVEQGVRKPSVFHA